MNECLYVSERKSLYVYMRTRRTEDEDEKKEEKNVKEDSQRKTVNTCQHCLL